MASSTGPESPTRDLDEPSRRKPGARGVPIRLADGADWLLAIPRFGAAGMSATSPDVDSEIDRLFEGSVLGGEVRLVDAWSAARTLLLANYHLGDDDLVDLFHGCDPRAFVSSVIEALFGPVEAARTYTDWARASLLANGIAPAAIAPRDLANVLSILVATKRTIPASQFIDASRAAEEQAALESLI